MNWNLFSKELKRNRNNLFIWIAIVMGLTLVVMAIFPYMGEMGDELISLMNNMPDGISKALGIDTHTWSNILGLYSMYYGIYILVLMAIYTASTGANILSKEERDGTAEFLLSKPISRRDIYFTKISVLLSLTFIIYLVQIFTAFIGVLSFGGESIKWDEFAVMHLHGLVIILLFTCFGVLLSMFISPKKNTMGMVVGIVFGAYFLDAISKAADAVSWIGYFTPYHYLSLSISEPNSNLSLVNIFASLTLSALMLIVSLKVYEKKDMFA